MAGVVANVRFGPSTYEVSTPIIGDRLVEPDGLTMKVKHAVANSTRVLGVSLYEAMPVGTAYEDTTSAGFPRIDHAIPQEYVAVAWTGEFKLLAAAAINFGALVVAGANGTVVPYVAAAAGAVGTSEQIIGRCTQPSGIVNGATGLIRLMLS